MRGRLAAGSLAALTLLAACAPAAAPAPVPLSLRIDHRFGAAPFELGREYRAGAQSPVVKVSRLAYYLGRFRLQMQDGRWVDAATAAAPDGGYVIVDLARPDTLRIETLRVPPGAYKALECLVGVDEDRNHAGAQTGALDPEHGLFWTWKTGYIFFALEGHSPASAASGGALTYHVGGNAALARTLVLPLSPALEVDSRTAASLVLQADVGEFFRGLALGQTHTVMSAEAAGPLADRYAMLFEVKPAAVRLVAAPIP